MTHNDAPVVGSVYLLKTPGGEQDAALVAYLASILPRVPPQNIADRITGKKPLSLLVRVPETASIAILQRLRELGAEASFEREGRQRPAEQPPAARKPLPARKTAGRASGRRTFKVLLPTGLVLLLVLALIAGFFGIGPRFLRPRPLERWYLIADAGRSLKMPNAPDFSGLTSFFPPALTIMQVPPREMLAAYRAQRQQRPDRRFPMALETLTRRWEQLAGIPAGTYRMGVAVYGENQIGIPMLRGKKQVSQIDLPLPASFEQGLGALGAWVEALELDSGKRQLAQAGTVLDGDAFQRGQGLTGQVDPRQIILGLQELDALARTSAGDPRLLLAAARGYAWLTFVLVPDLQSQTDPLAAEGLAFLALAKHLDPDLSVQREEAVMATALGYTGHAATLLRDRGEAPSVGEAAAIDAFLRRDPTTLRAVRDAVPPDDPDVLPHYLLARLYRSLGLHQEAKAAALVLIERSQTYPAILENIQSADLGLAKRLTVLYPLEILGRMEAQVDPDLLKDPAALERRLAAYSGEEPAGEIALSRFEALLGDWAPFGRKAPPRFLIDDDRVRHIFRILYSDALALRFDMLLHRWGVVKLAARFVDSVSSGGEVSPLVLSLQAELAAEFGQGDRAHQFASGVLADPAAGGMLAYNALMATTFSSKRPLFLTAAARFDGRPHNQSLLGYLYHFTLYDLESAAQCYETALAGDPFLFDAARLLATARGVPEPLEQAAALAPASYELAEETGDYFVERHDQASLSRAATAYQTAARMAPSRAVLSKKLGRLLKELKRYQEALAVYDAWLQGYGDDGLGTTIMKGAKAEVYLAMDQPRRALETIGDAIESYQGDVMLTAALAKERMGKPLEAATLYRELVERYPTSTGIARAQAAFMWRENDDQQAARILAGARPRNTVYSMWYADDFVRAFADASPERILAAVAELRSAGATSKEQLALGHWLDRRGRTDVAAAVAMAARGSSAMEDFVSIATAYGFLRRSAGQQAASEYFRGAVSEPQRGLGLMVLHTQGEYEGVLEEVGDPASYGPKYGEFMWLLALIATRALDDAPADWVDRLREHYAGAGSPDHYFAIGSFLQGSLSAEDLLGKITTAKQRCEIPYYLGLAARLEGDFATAAAWYQVSLQTGLENNGEYHWAGDEVVNWSHLGMAGRNRLPRDDVRAVHEKMHARDLRENR